MVRRGEIAKRLLNIYMCFSHQRIKGYAHAIKLIGNALIELGHNFEMLSYKHQKEEEKKIKMLIKTIEFKN